eukprot:gene5942-biopygen13277
MVFSIDNDHQRITLSTKSLEVNPGDMVENPQLVYEKAEEAAAAFRAGFPEAKARKQERMEARGVVDPNLKVHELRSGVVQDVSERGGVSVHIGAGVIGLLRNPQISDERVSNEDVEKMFSVGDKIKVMVYKISKAGHIILSTRSLEVNPGDMVKNPQLVYEKAEEAAAAFRAGFPEAEAEAEARKQERKKARGVVDPNLKAYELRSGVVQDVSERGGVSVHIGAGVIGLLRNPQISDECVSNEDVEKMFSVGDKIKVVVHKMRKDRPIMLSTKSLELNPGDMVKNPQLVYEKAEEAAAAFRAKVLEAEARKQERVEARGVVDPNLKVHELRSGVVQDIRLGVVWVHIGAGLIGMLQNAQISRECVTVKEVRKMFSVGDEIKIDNDRQRISLSTKNLEVNPGDMVKNPQLVYEKAEEAAAVFRAGVLEAEAEAEAHKQERDKVLRAHSKETRKVMVLEISKNWGRIPLSTRSLEVNPSDMVKNPQMVYEKAEGVAAAFRAKVEVSPILKCLSIRQLEEDREQQNKILKARHAEDASVHYLN